MVLAAEERMEDGVVGEDGEREAVAGGKAEDCQGFVGEVEAGEGFDNKVESTSCGCGGGGGVAEVVSVVKVAEKVGGSVVDEGGGEGVRSVVELEAGENVNGETLAVRGEESVGPGLGPGEEFEENAAVGLGVE